MRKILSAFVVGIALAAGLALAGQLPPLTPGNGGSDFLPAINALINQLNGGNGYTGTPQIVSLGPNCTVTGASGVTCNGQRGQIIGTGITVAGNSSTLFNVSNSFITAQTAQYCFGAITGWTGTLGTNGAPGLAMVLIPSPGTIQIILNNASATTTGSQTFTMNFWCV
jgi:hypothetical protein